MPPEVSIGICAYNEGKNIGKLLRNILEEQKLKVPFEVLVVASGCTDNTVGIVESYQKTNPNVRLFVEAERKGKASAINQIFKAAEGNTIIFASADTLPGDNCFNSLLTKMKQPKVGIVCGNPVPVNSKKTMTGRIVHMLWGFHGVVFQELNDSDLAKHATEVFSLRSGILDGIPTQTINDDAYIALTTRKKGWLVKYEPNAVVHMCGPQTINEYINQRRRILVGHMQVKKITGESPQHLLYMLPQHPLKATKLFLRFLQKNNIGTVTVFVSLEAVIYGLAYSDNRKKKSYTKWSTLSTTKELKA